MKLSIKSNKSVRQGKCGLCGKDMEAGIGYVLLMPESDDLVCDSCAIKNDPKLLALRHFITE